MNFIKAAKTTELPQGQKKKVSLEGREILLANIENTYYAMDNTCSHMGGSLAEGTLVGSHIVCPRHGSVFDVKSGKAVKGGKLLFITVKIHDLRSYPVKTEGTDILIGIE
jgi:3-phenylpropionate/trans-cinnamate dioxygenase ferredoxin subunit